MMRDVFKSQRSFVYVVNTHHRLPIECFFPRHPLQFVVGGSIGTRNKYAFFIGLRRTDVHHDRLYNTQYNILTVTTIFYFNGMLTQYNVGTY